MDFARSVLREVARSVMAMFLATALLVFLQGHGMAVRSTATGGVSAADQLKLDALDFDGNGRLKSSVGYSVGAGVAFALDDDGLLLFGEDDGWIADHASAQARGYANGGEVGTHYHDFDGSIAQAPTTIATVKLRANSIANVNNNGPPDFPFAWTTAAGKNPVITSGYLEMGEIAAPGASAAGFFRLYRDSTSDDVQVDMETTQDIVIAAGP